MKTNVKGPWSLQEDLVLLRLLAKGATLDELIRELGRVGQSISVRIKRLRQHLGDELEVPDPKPRPGSMEQRREDILVALPRFMSLDGHEDSGE